MVTPKKERALLSSTLDLELRKKLVKCYVWSIALYGAETWTLRAMDEKHLESFEMWCWRRMEKISWTDHVSNKEVLLRVKEQRNILNEIPKRKANWISHILRRNLLLQRVTEGNIQGGIEVTERQGRRRRKLLYDLKERRGYSHLKEEALDRTMWRARFGRDFGPVVRQTTKRMNEANSINSVRFKQNFYLYCTHITNIKAHFCPNSFSPLFNPEMSVILSVSYWNN